jgi:hypothetical protein
MVFAENSWDIFGDRSASSSSSIARRCNIANRALAGADRSAFSIRSE